MERYPLPCPTLWHLVPGTMVPGRVGGPDHALNAACRPFPWVLPSPMVLNTKRLFLLVSFVVALGFALVGGVVSDARAGIGDDVCPDAHGENTNTCPPGQVGVAYSITFKLPEGQGCSPGEDVWSIIGGDSPPGLSMSSSGTLSGTPTQAGAFFFYIQMALPDNPNCNGSKDTTQRWDDADGQPGGYGCAASCAAEADGRGHGHDGVVAGRERQSGVHVAGPDRDGRDGDLVDARRGHVAVRADARNERGDHGHADAERNLHGQGAGERGRRQARRRISRCSFSRRSESRRSSTRRRPPLA